MPLLVAGIIAGVGLIGNAIGTGVANKREKDAAEALAAQLREQENAYKARANEMMSELEGLRAGDIPIPIERVDPEDIKAPRTAYEALDDAKSDESMKNYVEGADKALATRIASASSDPRIASFVASKATQEYKQGIKTTADELAKDDVEAKMKVAGMEADINAQNAQNQLKADADYAAFKNQYLQQKESALQELIMEAEDAGFNVGYQATAMPLQQQAQAAANWASFAGDATSAGLQVAGMAEDGGKIKTLADGGVNNYLSDFTNSSSALSEQLQGSRSKLLQALDQISEPANKPNKKKPKKGVEDDGLTDEQNDALDAEMEDAVRDIDSHEIGGRIERLLSKEDGGQVTRTRGEFNHGSQKDPMSGNDQVLIDQEDLKAGLDSGAIQSYEDIEKNDMVQAITTGDELILNNEQSSIIENLAMQTAQKEMMAKSGKKVGKKRSPEQIRAAEKALAEYVRYLMDQPQFKG